MLCHVEVVQTRVKSVRGSFPFFTVFDGKQLGTLISHWTWIEASRVYMSALTNDYIVFVIFYRFWSNFSAVTSVPAFFVPTNRSKQHRRQTSNVAIEWNFLEIAIKRSIHRINSLTDSLAGLFSFSYHIHAANRSFPLKLRRYPLELSPRTGHSCEILEWRSNSVYVASSKEKRFASVFLSAISTIRLNLSLWIEQETRRWMLRDWSSKIPFDCFWKINLPIRDWFLTERKFPDPYRCSQILVDLIVGCSSFSLARWQHYILIFHDILCDISSQRSLFFFLSSLFSKPLFQCRITS